MRVSVKEFEDNFDIFLDMIENRTVDMIVIEDKDDPKKNVVCVPCSAITDQFKGKTPDQIESVMDHIRKSKS